MNQILRCQKKKNCRWVDGHFGLNMFHLWCLIDLGKNVHLTDSRFFVVGPFHSGCKSVTLTSAFFCHISEALNTHNATNSLKLIEEIVFVCMYSTYFQLHLSIWSCIQSWEEDSKHLFGVHHGHPRANEEKVQNFVLKKGPQNQKTGCWALRAS